MIEDDISKYVGYKKTINNIKKVAVAGVALATIIGGGVGLTSCEDHKSPVIKPSPTQPIYNNPHALRIEKYFRSKKPDFDMNYIYVRELDADNKVIECMEIKVGGYEPTITASGECKITEELFDTINALYEENNGGINKSVICVRDPQSHEIIDKYVTLEFAKDAIHNNSNNQILDLIYNEIRTNPTLQFTNYSSMSNNNETEILR